MDKTIQAKHIPDVLFLQTIKDLGEEMRRQGWTHEDAWVCRWAGNYGPGLEATLKFPPRVLMAKANKLIRRDLLSGCVCGCRGDFYLTSKGKKFLNEYVEEGIE